ncbi:Leucyl/phenylalanyl-tRNA--protein transferase [Aquisphaera giovannonii]|uniref:Leucyl/phenylalanyl-tRNA--protein transferase n=1 Tax=Aquisphaera giovannonii TaxID=406548 RepID=A0A5B9WCV5_9BACT|nr:leucyl/phenylalanyl-tRNA--protein transferase [Aquisphaera giovannonii]QEH38498.1 Leucyl/phenylalanyl-tRNA--protein transferase [Aquisphaera giovannonii]
MPVFRLGPEPIFPPPALADPEGILAIGGDLEPGRLLAAYREGIFPWYEAGGPILWWSPDPRAVLFLDELKVSRRLARTIRSGRFETRHDTAFAAVIRACAEASRPGEDGTWITAEMQRAYIRLHELGHAHSTEAWRDGKLVGGIYGVRVGRCFCGESMFHAETDASKVALVALVGRLKAEGVTMMDCQVASGHMLSLGAREIPRRRFLEELAAGLRADGSTE